MRNIWIIGALAVAILLLGRRVVFAAKPGAILSNKPEIEYARRVIARVWSSRGLTPTVTSGYDGTHSANSLHYEGLAEDYRTRDVPSGDLADMVNEVRAILGRDYDVIIESTHIHVEYDPT